jgi:hypothetical protein
MSILCGLVLGTGAALPTRLVSGTGERNLIARKIQMSVKARAGKYLSNK